VTIYIYRVEPHGEFSAIY